MRNKLLILLTVCWCSNAADVPLDVSKLQLKNVKAEAVAYKNRKAIRLTDSGAASLPDGARFAIIAGTDFQDGAIEVELTGDTVDGAAPEARGFTGLVFRAEPEGTRYESFYLRPKNGRSEDQLQRNHSAQYIAFPDFPWNKLRQEFPGKYESYVDLVPGEWIKMRIEVYGTQARLFVHNTGQPVLVVNDLKHGPGRGAVGLWIGPGTVAHFANLKISH